MGEEPALLPPLPLGEGWGEGRPGTSPPILLDPTMRNKTAAIIVIGNEILSGKVVDSNAAFAAKELRALGVSLQRIVVIPDDLDAIADTIRSYRSAFDVIFT